MTAGPDRDSFLLVSIGNSRAVIARADRSGSFADIRREPSEKLAAGGLGAGVAPVHLISVVEARARPLVEALRRDGRAVVWWGVDREIPIRHPYPAPEKPGADRLVAALAAWRRVRGACIVVDAGTAITVDAVAADGAWLGGAIAPGLPALREGLRAKLPALPAPGPESNAYPADSAPGAVSLGVRAAFAGAVFVLVAKAVQTLGSVPVLVTGGDAGPATEASASFRPAVVPELVLEGLAHLAASS